MVACVCPMDAVPAGASISRAEANARDGFSIEDTNTLYRMYATKLGTNSASEHYGRALASGDFDDDGYDDLAVGAPLENIRISSTTTRTDTGQVHIWKGTPGGLVAWRVLNQADFAGTGLTSNAKFGTALVAYDGNGDGVTDLAVGAPGAESGAGAVYLFRGTLTNGLIMDRKLTQALTGVGDDLNGDRFGEALAAGSITGQLCNGLPVHTLVVGAPGNMVAAGTLYAHTGPYGSVFLYHRASCTSTTLAKATVLNRGLNATAEDYGAALGVGDLDGDGRADLAVGAPRYQSGVGRVYLYKGRLPLEAPASWSAMATYKSTLSAATGTGEFGRALATGRVLAPGRDPAGHDPSARRAGERDGHEPAARRRDRATTCGQCHAARAGAARSAQSTSVSAGADPRRAQEGEMTRGARTTIPIVAYDFRCRCVLAVSLDVRHPHRSDARRAQAVWSRTKVLPHVHRCRARSLCGRAWRALRPPERRKKGG